MKKILMFLLLQTLNVSFSTVCLEDFEETICENFDFSSDLILNSSVDRLTIKNATGAIIHEHFSKLTTVTGIKITESDITSIEPGALCCMPNLTSVIIVNNVRFPKITRANLQGCQHVKSVYLKGEGLEIANGAFIDAKNLQSLSLNRASLPCSLGEAFFKGLASLKTLTIRHTACERIDRDAFKTLGSLRFLDLGSNDIATVANGAFGGLSQLKTLNLGNNKVKNFAWTEFEGLKNLRVLFLEHNDFREVDAEKLASSVPALERVFFSYDKLSEGSRKKIENVLPKLNITFIYIGKPL